MRPRAPTGTRPRPRSALLLLLLLAPVAALAGCLEDEEGPRLAQPTNATVGIPRATTPAAPTIVYNLSDPGYVMSGSWRVGDGWDYESNKSNFRKLRVVDARIVGNRTDFLVEETTGIIGNAPRGRASVWVEGGNWTRLNETDFFGTRTEYKPGQPLRHHRNGTFSYNETVTDSRGNVLERREVAANSRLVGRQTLLFSWGYVEAAKVEHRVTTRVDGELTRTLVTRWAHRDYLNDVKYQIDTGSDIEVFTLVAAQVGSLRRGELRTT